jgi:uncharacterized protein (DUF302 family)
MANYYNSKIVDINFEAAIELVQETLKIHGFGVLTRINVHETLKNKLDVNFRKYVILGACNPTFAHKALQIEDNVGLMLPCNMVIQEHKNGQVEISAISPVASLQAIENPELDDIVSQVEYMLKDIIEKI